MISPGKLCQFSKTCDGAIDLLFFTKVSRAELAQALLSIEDGSFVNLPFVKYYKVKAFMLEPEEGKTWAPIGIDGEHTTNQSIYVEVHQALANFFYDSWDDSEFFERPEKKPKKKKKIPHLFVRV
eukprot:TRINITY_DN3870_c0_g3_i1.p1 TRINITY_DN3870_c0_g3~~TRINITY_DN3870_c0_g3_i1.p1  ORF type:complete len:125 (+),score=30.45 TRINITY_DN3870_c0_g3_i1:452-826(+)